MTRNRILGALLVSALGMLTVPAARAAQLTQVTADWTGGTSFPSDVTMYIYVPDKVAANPPILVLSHYCGGAACDVFSQAKGNRRLRMPNSRKFSFSKYTNLEVGPA